MLVGSVAGVDDIRLNPVCQEFRRTGSRMPDHHHVDPHRFQIAGSIYQRLALRNARAARGDVHRIRGESFLGELEGYPRTRGVFEKEVDDGRAAKRGNLLDRALADFLEWFGGIEYEANLLARE